MNAEMIKMAPTAEQAAELINKNTIPTAHVDKGPSQKHILMAFEGLE